jgi:hypothetical protein
MSYWSGVVVEGSGDTSVTGDWTVPSTTTYCGTSADLASWVGLGGFGHTYSAYPFVQNGVARNSSGAITAWYEVFDKYGNTSTVDVPFAVKPGDVVRFALRFTTDHSHLTFVWFNTTTRLLRTVTLANAAHWWSGHSVEWIDERYPDWSGHLGPLARFTTPITVTNAGYTVNGGATSYSPLAAPSAFAMSMNSTSYPYASLAHTTYSMASPRRFSTAWTRCS